MTQTSSRESAPSTSLGAEGNGFVQPGNGHEAGDQSAITIPSAEATEKTPYELLVDAVNRQWKAWRVHLQTERGIPSEVLTRVGRGFAPEDQELIDRSGLSNDQLYALSDFAHASEHKKPGGVRVKRNKFSSSSVLSEEGEPHHFTIYEGMDIRPLYEFMRDQITALQAREAVLQGQKSVHKLGKREQQRLNRLIEDFDQIDSATAHYVDKPHRSREDQYAARVSQEANRIIKDPTMQREIRRRVAMRQVQFAIHPEEVSAEEQGLSTFSESFERQVAAYQLATMRMDAWIELKLPEKPKNKRHVFPERAERLKEWKFGKNGKNGVADPDVKSGGQEEIATDVETTGQNGNYQGIKSLAVWQDLSFKVHPELLNPNPADPDGAGDDGGGASLPEDRSFGTNGVGANLPPDNDDNGGGVNAEDMPPPQGDGGLDAFSGGSGAGGKEPPTGLGGSSGGGEKEMPSEDEASSLKQSPLFKKYEYLRDDVDRLGRQPGGDENFQKYRDWAYEQFVIENPDLFDSANSGVLTYLAERDADIGRAVEHILTEEREFYAAQKKAESGSQTLEKPVPGGTGREGVRESVESSKTGAVQEEDKEVVAHPSPQGLFVEMSPGTISDQEKGTGVGVPVEANAPIQQAKKSSIEKPKLRADGPRRGIDEFRFGRFDNDKDYGHLGTFNTMVMSEKDKKDRTRELYGKEKEPEDDKKGFGKTNRKLAAGIIAGGLAVAAIMGSRDGDNGGGEYVGLPGGSDGTPTSGPVYGYAEPTSTPTKTPTETATATPESTETPTETPTPTASATLEPTLTPTSTPTIAPTEAPTLTPTGTSEPTEEPTEVVQIVPSKTEIPSPTETTLPTATATATKTETATPTATATETETSLSQTPTPEKTTEQKIEKEAGEMAGDMVLIEIDEEGDSISGEMKEEGLISETAESTMSMEEFKALYNDPDAVAAFILINLDQFNEDWKADGLPTKTPEDIRVLAWKVKMGEATMDELWGEQVIYGEDGEVLDKGASGIDRVKLHSKYMVWLTDEEWKEAVALVYAAQINGNLSDLSKAIRNNLEEKGLHNYASLVAQDAVNRYYNKRDSDDEKNTILV